MAKLFVLTIPAFGAALLGKVSKDNFEQWRKKQEVLKLITPKRFVVGAGTTQAADPHTQTSTVHIGPAYSGDTDQDVMYLDNAAVEVIGEITLQNNEEICPAAYKMFAAYNKAVLDYQSRHSNIIAPSALDIHAVSKGATTIPFQKLER